MTGRWWDGYPVCDECGHILMGEADADRCSLCGAYGRTYRRADATQPPPPPEPPRVPTPGTEAFGVSSRKLRAIADPDAAAAEARAFWGVES